MPLPEFSTCCCGCSLRTGSFIIGYLGAFGSLYYILAAALGFDGLPVVDSGIDENWQSNPLAALVIFLVLCVIQFVFYSILIVSTYKCNAKCLRIFVTWATTLLAFVAIGIVLNFMAGDIVIGIGNILGILIQAYFILIVRSYYLELESSTGQDITFLEKAHQIGQVGYQAQLGYEAPPGYPAPPTYTPQSVYQNQTLGYPVYIGTETLKDKE